MSLSPSNLLAGALSLLFSNLALCTPATEGRTITFSIIETSPKISLKLPDSILENSDKLHSTLTRLTPKGHARLAFKESTQTTLGSQFSVNITSPLDFPTEPAPSKGSEKIGGAAYTSVDLGVILQGQINKAPSTQHALTLSFKRTLEVGKRTTIPKSGKDFWLPNLLTAKTITLCLISNSQQTLICEWLTPRSLSEKEERKHYFLFATIK